MKDRFSMALFAAVVLTALFGLMAGALAFFGPINPTPTQIRLVDALITLSTTGAVTIFALLNVGRLNDKQKR